MLDAVVFSKKGQCREGAREVYCTIMYNEICHNPRISLNSPENSECHINDLLQGRLETGTMFQQQEAEVEEGQQQTTATTILRSTTNDD